MLESHDPASTGVVYRRAGTGRATWALGSLFERLLCSEESGGALDLALVTQPAGTATSLHRHTREAEAFYLLEGTMTYRAGEQTYHLGAGDFLYLPQGLPHALRVTGTGPTTFLGLTAPAGLVDLYEEIGTAAEQRRLPGPDGGPLNAEIAAWTALAPRYGLQIVGPPLSPDA